VASVSDLTVRIRADTRPLMRSLNRVRRTFWFMQWKFYIGVGLGLTVGFLLGIVGLAVR
jgi:ElaB/YqjD/DUF883 family membrane-anchored ribosome-binding protein